MPQIIYAPNAKKAVRHTWPSSPFLSLKSKPFQKKVSVISAENSSNLLADPIPRCDCKLDKTVKDYPTLNNMRIGHCQITLLSISPKIRGLLCYVTLALLVEGSRLL